MRLGIRYFEDDLGASGSEAGALLRGRTGRLAVVVNEHLRYESRKRFTAAHEVGHARLPHHQQSEFWCTSEEIETYRPTRQVEREANEFAAALLLPSHVVRQHLKYGPATMPLAKELAEKFGMSLTATACRVVTSTEDRCALALSGANEIRWIVASSSLHRRCTLRRSGQVVSADSVAHDLLHRIPIREGPQRVAPGAWLNGWELPSLTHLVEEAVPFPELGLVLSFLSIPEDDEDELDDGPE